MTPISKNIIEVPTIIVVFVNNITEVENLELKLCQTAICFDNNQPTFYTREKDRHGKYSEVKVYFYDSLPEKLQMLKREEYIQKCKDAGLNDIDTKIAEKAFIDNMKNEALWDWMLKNKIKDVSLDTIRKIKWKIRCKLCPELIDHSKWRNKNVDTKDHKILKNGQQ